MSDKDDDLTKDLSQSTPNRPTWQSIAASKFAVRFLAVVIDKLHNYSQLMRLHRPIGALLLLWPALWALWVASVGRPNQHVFIVFVLGVFLTRSAGCAINDFADRNYDGHVSRTKDRPLAAKRITPIEALIVFAVVALVALALATTLNALALKLAVAGGVMMATYPFFKRFFPAPQLYLGIAFAWSIPMAYAAQAGNVPQIAWLLFIAGILWTTAYDTMYAMTDRADDLKLGVKSSAILFGESDRMMIGVLQMACLFTLWLVGHNLHFGAWFYGGLGVAAIFSIYQQYLIKDREPGRCFAAFINNNYFGMSVFIGIALDYLFR
jgi:4-hydroxybenzoate polyprenyltransferase